jgi:hypothetical protein
MTAGISKIPAPPLFAAALAILSNIAWSEGASAASAPIFTKSSDAALSRFRENPAALLTTNSFAGLFLISEVRGLLIADPGLVVTLIEVARNGNDVQKAAIGAGLAQASRTLARNSPELAVAIQRAVAQSGILPLIAAYIAGSGDVATGAIGGGVGGGAEAGGGGGPMAGAGSSASPTGGVRLAPNISTTDAGFARNSAPGAGAFANGGATIAITTSVSPSIP